MSKTSTNPFLGSPGRITRRFERLTVDKTFAFNPGPSLKLISDCEPPSFSWPYIGNLTTNSSNKKATEIVFMDFSVNFPDADSLYFRVQPSRTSDRSPIPVSWLQAWQADLTSSK
jgi:hypothetical protein